MKFPAKVKVINTDGLNLSTSGDLLDPDLVCLGIVVDEDEEPWAIVQNRYGQKHQILLNRIEFLETVA